MINLHQLTLALDELRAFVVREPRLAEFAALGQALYEQAAQLEGGERKIPRLANATVPTIPDRELAVQIVRILDHVPTTDGDEGSDLALALAILQANIGTTFALAVFRSFPDVAPRSTS